MALTQQPSVHCSTRYTRCAKLFLGGGGVLVVVGLQASNHFMMPPASCGGRVCMYTYVGGGSAWQQHFACRLWRGMYTVVF